MDVTLRWCTEADDIWTVAAVDNRAFGVHSEPQHEELWRLVHDMRDFLVAEVDGDPVGLTCSYPFEMTVPGGRLDVRGVTWVSVLPTHTRRGVLTSLLREQHERFVAEGIAVAVLTASEGGIYGRFGYGPASHLRRLAVTARRARLRADLPDGGPVRMVGQEEAEARLPPLHERWRATHPGALSRSASWWQALFLDRSRPLADRRFYVVHDEGYLVYRVEPKWDDGHPSHVLHVDELVSTTPDAHLALWRFMLGVDLAGTIRTWNSPLDDALPFLLDDPRQARTEALNDGVWVRLLDVPVALAARRYAVPGELVLDVHDAFLGRGGRVRLAGGPDGATCAPTTDEADLELDVAALGSLYLGAHRASTLARARRVVERTPGALGRADLLFGAERQPLHGTSF